MKINLKKPKLLMVMEAVTDDSHLVSFLKWPFDPQFRRGDEVTDQLFYRQTRRCFGQSSYRFIFIVNFRFFFIYLIMRKLSIKYLYEHKLLRNPLQTEETLCS